jgi:hypothetical protein
VETVSPRKRAKPARKAPIGWAAELAMLIALLLVVHVGWSYLGLRRDGEVILIELTVAAWLVWRLFQSMRPRQRIVTWTRPRKASDTARR